jgi:NCS2 family nucleobase:cation symporter-2
VQEASARRAAVVVPVTQPNSVDALLPPRRLAVLGLQHVLVMYAGAVAVPLIIGRALGLSTRDLALLVSADMFACGLATLIQTLGIFGVGIRLPIMMGVTFASVSPMLAVITLGRTAGTESSEILRTLFGAVIVAGLFGLVVAPLVSRLRHWFPPVVTGSVILTIGISLMRIGIDWVGGGQSSAEFGAPLHLGLSLLVLVIILLLMKYGRGLVRNTAVLLGIVSGTVVAALLGQLNFAAVLDAGWLQWVRPLQFGMVHFDAASSLTMCLVMLVVMVESFGMFLAVGAMVDQPPEARDLKRGLLGDAIGTVIGGLFNTFPYTSFSQNIGLIGVTGVRSRYVCAAAGGIMLLLGLSPKLGAMMAIIPSFVLGGAGLVMFGMIAATGIRILSTVDLSGQRHNATIVAISVSVGLAPLLAPTLFRHLPPVMAPLLNSGVALGTVAAVLLNQFFNARNRTEAVAPVLPASE